VIATNLAECCLGVKEKGKRKGENPRVSADSLLRKKHVCQISALAFALTAPLPLSRLHGIGPELSRRSRRAGLRGGSAAVRRVRLLLRCEPVQ